MELPQGTLDLLILKAVALEPQHGWAISARLHQISSATLQIRQGSLYPAYGVTMNIRQLSAHRLRQPVAPAMTSRFCV